MSRVLAHGAVVGSWQWQPHPDVWAVMLLLAAGYLLALRRLGPRSVSPGEPPAARGVVILFCLGVGSMWLAADWPIHEISERYLFSVHMVQHLVFAFVSAPLLLLGTPDWMARGLTRPRAVHFIARRLTRPVPAMLLFNGFLVLSHWPVFVEATLTSGAVHFAAHSVLLGVSLLMWWPVLSPLPELPRISQPAQLLYLFLQTIVPTVPASFLTFAESPFYRLYAEAQPRLWGLSPVTDQRAAGLIMKLGGGLFLWTVIAVKFFRWSAKEESGRPDQVEWQDIERELNRSGMGG